jgi:acyl carrier protein
MHDDIKAIMADVLNIDPDSIDESTSSDTVETWDSLAHINLVSALEQRFTVTLDVEEIEAMLSFTAIVETLERRI